MGAFQSLGSFPLTTLTSAIGLSSRTGGITSSTNANPIVVTDNDSPGHHGLLSGTITNVSGSNPLAIASTAHGLSTGDRIIITGLVGPTILNSLFVAAKGIFTTWLVSKIDANTFSVFGAAPVDFAPSYTSGGTWYRPELFRIDGHTTNTAANGSFNAVYASSSTFTLLGSTGNGVGGATGTWRTIPIGTKGVLLQALTANVNWRDDGTDPTASSTDGSNQFYAGDEPILFTGDIWRFRAINQAASSGGTLNAEYVTW